MPKVTIKLYDQYDNYRRTYYDNKNILHTNLSKMIPFLKKGLEKLDFHKLEGWYAKIFFIRPEYEGHSWEKHGEKIYITKSNEARRLFQVKNGAIESLI